MVFRRAPAPTLLTLYRPRTDRNARSWWSPAGFDRAPRRIREAAFDRIRAGKGPGKRSPSSGRPCPVPESSRQVVQARLRDREALARRARRRKRSWGRAHPTLARRKSRDDQRRDWLPHAPPEPPVATTEGRAGRRRANGPRYRAWSGSRPSLDVHSQAFRQRPRVARCGSGVFPRLSDCISSLMLAASAITACRKADRTSATIPDVVDMTSDFLQQNLILMRLFAIRPLEGHEHPGYQDVRGLAYPRLSAGKRAPFLVVNAGTPTPGC
jgi:hypothetical protein